ncbi:MAG: metal-dependent transcriptional regulator [Anaerolineales bacterium]|nr:metal-dependent transcriptional regulator [Anaerolineales bacterium]
MAQNNKTQTETRPTPTIEDYLAIIYVMARDGEKVIAARLAETLEVASSTVTVTLKRMERDGWIAAETGKDIHLTDQGGEAARSVIRRHMLTEWMLARMLNVPWSRVHAEADQIEHAISEALETQMRTNLDDPQLCPHGNPLPGYEHVAADWLPLTRVLPGETVIIRRIHEIAEDNHELLEFLEQNGIVPGAQVEVAEVLPFNQTMRLKVGNQNTVLGFPTAKYIYIEKQA